MTRTITSFLATVLIVSSAGIALASGDGAAMHESIRNTQRGVVTAPAKASVPFSYFVAADRNVSIDPAGHERSAK
jgi:hypothetical protein